jgi:hypothetical protein
MKVQEKVNSHKEIMANSMTGSEEIERGLRWAYSMSMRVERP